MDRLQFFRFFGSIDIIYRFQHLSKFDLVQAHHRDKVGLKFKWAFSRSSKDSQSHFKKLSKVFSNHYKEPRANSCLWLSIHFARLFGLSKVSIISEDFKRFSLFPNIFVFKGRLIFILTYTYNISNKRIVKIFGYIFIVLIGIN